MNIQEGLERVSLIHSQGPSLPVCFHIYPFLCCCYLHLIRDPFRPGPREDLNFILYCYVGFKIRFCQKSSTRQCVRRVSIPATLRIAENFGVTIVILTQNSLNLPYTEIKCVYIMYVQSSNQSVSVNLYSTLEIRVSYCYKTRPIILFTITTDRLV